MMTIRQIYDQYIYSRGTYCSKETIEKYSDDLRLFFRFLERNYMISVDAAAIVGYRSDSRSRYFISSSFMSSSSSSSKVR